MCGKKGRINNGYGQGKLNIQGSILDHFLVRMVRNFMAVCYNFHLPINIYLFIMLLDIDKCHYIVYPNRFQALQIVVHSRRYCRRMPPALTPHHKQ